MGSKRSSGGGSSTTQSSTQSTPQPLPEQREQIKLQLERQKAAQPGLLELDQALLQSITPLVRGQSLPGQFSSLGQGISEDVQQDIIDKSLRDIAPRFEKLGVGASGPAAQISANLARDIRIQSELERVRQRENLLNVAQGFPATVNQPILQTSATLASQLQGLTPISTTSSGRGSFSNFQSAPSNTFGQVLGTAGSFAARKVIARCVPENFIVDTPNGPVFIENISVGDEVLDGSGKPCKVRMKHEYLEDMTTDRFVEISFNDETSIKSCDNHIVSGVPAGDVVAGDVLSGKEVVSTGYIEMEGKSFDLLTDGLNGSYRSNGVFIATMIPFLHSNESVESIRGVNEYAAA